MMTKKDLKKILLLIFVNAIFINLFSNANNIESINIPFVENKGQFNKNVLYLVNTFGGNVYISDKCELVYTLFNKKTKKTLIFKELFSINNSLSIKGEKQAFTKVNYFNGKKNPNCKTNVKTYEYINIGDIASGISVKIHANYNNIEKLFYIQPNANVNDIFISCTEIKPLKIEKSGELILFSDKGNVSFTKPYAYQLSENGNRQYIDIEYKIIENGYGFKVGYYDKSKELIIDPLIASSFIGSNSFDDDYGPSMLLDNDKNVYLCGFTTSETFPYVGGVDSLYNGGKDIFIAKFNNDLTTLLVSTFIGGSGNEYEATMAFDKQKQNIFVSGYTSSLDFPITDNAYDTSNNGGIDVYVLKINKDLNILHSSTYLGGSANEGQQWPKLDITINKYGNVYITGLTSSYDFPVFPGISYDTSFSGANIGGDAFIAMFNDSLSNLLASTYIGGSAEEWRMSIDLDSNDNVFVSGETTSYDFPFTLNSYNHNFNGASDIFICKFNNNLSNLLAATSFGKYNYEEPLDIKIDKDNNVYIAGYTKSINFTTTTGVYNNVYSGGDRDGYIAKFNNNLSTLIASTFLGADNRDDCTTLNIDLKGNVYVAGNTKSYNFPCSANAYDTVFHGGNEYGDAFISVLDKDLRNILYSTYFGGYYDDRALSIVLDDTGNVFISGYSKSFNFPHTNSAYDTLNTGLSGDCFISKFRLKLNDINVDIKNKSNSYDNSSFMLNAYPNPLISNTIIKFKLLYSADVSLSIYDETGKLVNIILNEFKQTGTYTFNFNRENLKKGIYLCKLSVDNKNEYIKLILN